MGHRGLGAALTLVEQVTSVEVWPAALAVLLVVPRPVWRRTRHVVTVAHEGGHALVAVLCGRRLSGVRLHTDTSGLTVSRGRPRGAGMVLTLAAGYPAPAVLGLVASWVLGTGHVVALLWGLVALLVLLLLGVRNPFGVLLVVVLAGALGLVAYRADPTGQHAVAHVATWFLLLAAPRPVVELVVRPSRRTALRSDPQQLAALTHVPAALWVLLFGVVTVGAAAVGAWLLLGLG